MDNIQIESKFERQIELEMLMISEGITQYRKQRYKALEKNVEAATPAGLSVLKQSIEPFTQLLEKYLQAGQSEKAGRRPAAYKYLAQFEPETIAYLATRSVLNSITKRMTLQQTAFAIAGLLEDELRFRLFEKELPFIYDKIYDRIKMKSSYEYKRTVLVHAMGKKGLEWESWPHTDKLQIGVACIVMLIESTKLVELVLVPTAKNDTTYYVCATEKTLAWLQEEHERQELLSPMYLPTVIPPKDWTTPFDGGYHSGLAHRLKLVTTYNRAYLEELQSVEMPQVYRAVNTVQKTPWKINASVLNVLETLWRSNAEIVDLPPRDKQDPRPCPFPSNLKTRNMTPEQLEVFYDWKREAANVYEQNIINGSKRVLLETILKVANMFKDEPEIFFPYMLDFRGRVYAIPSFLNPQGSDMAKALLTFAHGKPITDQKAADWLAIHGANLYGYEKQSFAERLQWVKDHEADILASADDPFENRFWTMADDGDKPWQFLAFCFEWAAFVREGFGYVSSLPIALDGSCNGLQHFSAMLRDPVGGEAVNLLPSDTPQDIYQRVADVAIGKLQQISDGIDPDCKPEHRILAHKWLELGLDRDVTKRPVMILPYGGTRLACRKYVTEYLRKRLKDRENPFATEDRDCIFEASDFLAGVIWDSIGEVVISAREAMRWLRKASALAAKEGLPVNWTTPSGFPVQQAYREFLSRRIETRLSGNLLRSNYRHRLRISLVEPTDRIDKRRQNSGISPNFVHSMDAACLHLYVCRASALGIENFSLIHDSYGTLAADTETSAQCIRDVFVEMYQNDVLATFRTEILAQLSPENAGKLPPLPSKGNLDLEAIRQSAFFFA